MELLRRVSLATAVAKPRHTMDRPPEHGSETRASAFYLLIRDKSISFLLTDAKPRVD
jgi:hypothetical protein